MLHVFCGKDAVVVREAAYAHIKKSNKNKEEITYVDDETFSPRMVFDLAESSSLFGGEQVVLIDEPSKNTELIEEVFEALPLLSESKNIFVVIEAVLKAPEKKKYEKYGELTEITAHEEKSAYNVFSFNDAFLSRDKKRMWLLLQESIGVPREEIIGVLFWQIKILRLVAKTHSPEESGQKPFVYNKTKGALSKYSESEIDELSRSLVLLYHKAHQGEGDIDIMFENWVLSI